MGCLGKLVYLLFYPFVLLAKLILAIGILPFFVGGVAIVILGILYLIVS